MAADISLYDECKDAMKKLALRNRQFAKGYPGDRPDRQPVHTVYGGAHLFKHDTPQKLGKLALASLDEHAPNAFVFARAIGLLPEGSLALSPGEEMSLAERFATESEALRVERRDEWLALAVHDRVRKKLEREAVEDFRLDFEDGFGNRPDPEEDEVAIMAAREVAKGMDWNTLSPCIGIRIKPLNEELHRRAIRTLEIFVTTLVKEGGRLPSGFVVTLPKVSIPEQVRAFVSLLEALEDRLGLPKRSLELELMIELTQSLFDRRGRFNLPRLLKAADGRCVAAHFGTYDYTASAGITAAYQKVDHPACDFALQMMKVAFAGTGVWLSDGATNVMPVGPHRAPSDGALSPDQERENHRVVHAAWKLSYDHILHALRNGFYQGWDLHPAQLPIRYAACYAFFLQGFDAASERLRNFLDKAAQATLVGDVFDDAATGQGLLNYFLRGLSSGAVSLDELAVTGLNPAELQSRSFVQILKGRTVSNRDADSARDADA
jgi:citrate lyase beta subunit